MFSPSASKQICIHHLKEKKSSKTPHERTFWSYMATSHITGLPGLQRKEYEGVQRTWQGRDSEEGRAGCQKPDSDDAPFWGADGWGLHWLRPPTWLLGERHERKGSSDRKGAKNIWTQSTALISWAMLVNTLRVHTYIINIELYRYLSVHMQKAGIKSHNTHNCYVRRMTKGT